MEPALAISRDGPPPSIGHMAPTRQCPRCQGPAAPVYIFAGAVFSYHRCLDDGRDGRGVRVRCGFQFRAEPN